LRVVTLLSVFVLAIVGAFIGTRLAEVPKISRSVLAASGALLIAISLFWVLPEAASHHGWAVALLWVGCGFAVLWLVDHFVHPICPTCSHTHDHGGCSTPLHGFAPPLLIAIGLHSFLDGWALAVSQQGSEVVRIAVLLGIGLHKLPEGMALGAIVRASMASHTKSLMACIVAEAMTIVGGLAAFGMAATVGASWAGILFAAAAGAFIYLGYHAIDAEVRRQAGALRRARSSPD